MRRLLVIGVLAAVAALVSPLGPAPARAEAALVADGVDAEWTGGPFMIPTPLGADHICPAGPSDPTCDHHDIRVEPGSWRALEVTVTNDDWSSLDIVVFDANGRRVASANSGSDVEVLVMPARAGTFTVSVAPYAVSPLAGSGRFEAVARLTDGEPRSDLGCASSVPDLQTPVDAPMSLSVLTLLDGISLERGQTLVERARTSWDDIGVDLSVTFDDSFDVAASDVGIDHQGEIRGRATSSEMFRAARDHVGGAVPYPFDAVVVMTDKDLNDNGLEYMGVAYCIGALGDADDAFALGEAWADSWESPLGHQPDLAALIWSHELGHLANAPHHYGECTLGAARPDAGDGSHVGEQTCSLMQYIGGAGTGKLTNSNLYFSHLNRTVVRAHVARHGG